MSHFSQTRQKKGRVSHIFTDLVLHSQLYEDLRLRNPTVAPRQRNQFSARLHAQFCQNMRDMIPQCLFTNHQSFRNLCIA